MTTTKERQKKCKEDLDRKIRESRPSRALLEELAVACASNPSPDNTFQYAFALSKSTERSELQYAVALLDGLIQNETVSYQQDCMYGAATALYLLRDYQGARSRAEAILRAQPDSRMTKELHLAILEAQELQQQEDFKNTAVGSVAAAAAVGVVAGVAAMLLSSGKRR